MPKIDYYIFRKDFRFDNNNNNRSHRICVTTELLHIESVNGFSRFEGLDVDWTPNHVECDVNHYCVADTI